jgi:hypothetical protein
VISIVVAVLAIIVAVGIYGLETFKRKKFIAEIIDGHDIPDDSLSKEFRDLLRGISDPSVPKKRGYKHFTLPDGSKISRETNSTLYDFKIGCNLYFSPTDLEWEILRQYVKKNSSKL